MAGRPFHRGDAPAGENALQTRMDRLIVGADHVRRRLGAPRHGVRLLLEADQRLGAEARDGPGGCSRVAVLVPEPNLPPRGHLLNGGAELLRDRLDIAQTQVDEGAGRPGSALGSGQSLAPTSTGSLASSTPNVSLTPSRTVLARASRPAVVASPGLTRASVCLDEIRAPAPIPEPATVRATRSSAAKLWSSSTGLRKNEPTLLVSGSPGSSTIPLPRRRPRTAERTSASGARPPSGTPSARASSA